MLSKQCLYVLPLIFSFVGITAKLSDEELFQFPRVFHLDDYKKCLSLKNGVYCLGEFDLTPNDEPHHLYNLMKKHSEDRYNFNRTRIHRGYCLNARSPSAEKNFTRRFEKYADDYAQKYNLRATLRELYYCRTHEDRNDKASPEQTLFVQVIYAIIVLNLIGTAYDVMTGDEAKKIKLLTAWSIPANWNRLTYISKESDPRIEALTPIQGVRIAGLVLIMYAHARVFPFTMYTSTPDELEGLLHSPEGAIFSNGTIIVHGFILLTSFLTSYHLLVYSQKNKLGFYMLPMCIFKRIIRIIPVHLLLVGYASTWWGSERDGPLLVSTVTGNKTVCHQKLWTHLFFANNIIDKENICLMPTWYLPVDMHLYLLACILTFIMWRHRSSAIPIYAACFVLTIIHNAVMCYINGWSAAVQFVTAENLRKMFYGVESFTHFYTSTWGGLPACFVGLFMGHLHFELQEKGFKGNDHKWFVILHNLAIPLGVLWQNKGGAYATQQSSLEFAAVFVALDRLVFFTVIFFLIFGLINVDGPLKRFYGWQGWQPLARMSLTVMLLHWMVNRVIAARPTAYGTSTFDTMLDLISIVVITYGVAVPVTVLYEIPMQRFFNALL